ncbi:hypothetical protein [Rhodococcus erythropolis]|uniref:hypothetical protein n=1 Tax=Rhodococcus erythropolis TaxID=1833 RepID=UPI000A8A5225|nr:hypothetical protein [Rhodococcus erythropolis]
MGTFDSHSDVHEIPSLRGPQGLAAVGLWQLCGTWSSANGRTGFVPDEVVERYAVNQDEVVQQLVEAGLWEHMEGGYKMLRGPSDDPDIPLPLWRYSDHDLGGRMFAVDDTPNT